MPGRAARLIATMRSSPGKSDGKLMAVTAPGVAGWCVPGAAVIFVTTSRKRGVEPDGRE